MTKKFGELVKSTDTLRNSSETLHGSIADIGGRFTMLQKEQQKHLERLEQSEKELRALKKANDKTTERFDKAISDLRGDMSDIKDMLQKI